MKLEKEFKYYLENQEMLVKEYNGKYIVIKGEKILGAYNSHREALENTVAIHKLGSFLIQLCKPGEEDYSLTFHSNVTFSFN
ncbi:MAG: hypothetical protein FJ214_07665 [Ignavibacteria bacterium]|nr:hypothetical protein [Ignavibacteria bacterium]